MGFVLTGILLGAFGCRDSSDAVVRATGDYAGIARRLEQYVEREVVAHQLPAVSIALVDGQEVVWARGFGLADPSDSAPATANTVYRVGSVSKLFTDIGVMQLVERGELDLDVPITDYLPDFRPENPFETPITLRWLMTHRSGLVREPPVGHYLDSSGPSLAETVRSLNGTKLVYPPGTRTKYSNAAIAVAGYVLEQTQHVPFARYLERAVLEPAGLSSSAFGPDSSIEGRVAKAQMWTYDGRRFDAPTFQLGMAPAASMYSTVLDLGRFLSMLFAASDDEAGIILRAETLRDMWTAPRDETGVPAPYGIGFRVSDFQGHRRVGHDGAIYGFATTLAALPDDELGAVVIASRDIANTITARIAHAALAEMLAAGAGRSASVPPQTDAVPPSLVKQLAGRYGVPNAGRRAYVELGELGGTLTLSEPGGEFRQQVRMLGDTLITDGPLGYGQRLLLVDGGIVFEGDTMVRLTVARPRAPPERWRPLIGEYGWDYNTLYILEKDGGLHALIEWFFEYPLTEVSTSVFAFPDAGLYQGEQVVFERDELGRVTAAEAGGMVFPRRPVGAGNGATFKITPLRPADELTREALTAIPPEEKGVFREPDLVELTELDATILRDMRYATTNNFVSTAFYTEGKAFMQRPAAEALVRAHRKLRDQGYGLLIHDAYRPWYVSKMFWDATPDSLRMFVANPERGSRHNRGSAVDLTLYERASGRPVRMVGGYDEFSPRAFPGYPGGTSRQRWYRDLLKKAMESEGFSVYVVEWWHFDYKDWPEYPITNLTFEEIGGGGR